MVWPQSYIKAFDGLEELCSGDCGEIAGRAGSLAHDPGTPRLLGALPERSDVSAIAGLSAAAKTPQASSSAACVLGVSSNPRAAQRSRKITPSSPGV